MADNHQPNRTNQVGPTRLENTKPGTTDTLDEPTQPSTTSAPIGPKPGQVRNVTIEKMAQGWVVSWLPPVDKSVHVAHYKVEHKEGDGKWIQSEPIAKETAYLSQLPPVYWFERNF